MTVAVSAPLAEVVSAEAARDELSRFFLIADIAEKAPEMFSKFIDAEWHRMMASKNDYTRFCMDSVGHPVEHKEGPGHGVVSWIDLYHERFGTLPTAWFASAEGIVDLVAYGSYMDSRTTSSSFDCTPTTDSPDATPLVTAWDCSPQQPDPDVKPKAKPGLITSWDCSPAMPDPDFVKTSPDTPAPPVPDEVVA